MNGGPIRLAGRIRDELAELDRVVQRIEEAWRRSQRSSDDYYLDSVALSLHGFYGGLERLFELIATTLDGQKPAGSPLFLDMVEDAKILLDRGGFFARRLDRLRERLAALGARRIWRGNAWYWDLKPDYKPGDLIEL